ncbi:hypothetical protein Q7P36_008303 [Cladosporium allicinum]
MDKLSKEELDLMRRTPAIIDPDPSLDGVIWEWRVVPEGSEDDGALHGVLIDCHNEAENVAIIYDSERNIGIIFVVAPNTVNPMDTLDPEIDEEMTGRAEEQSFVAGRHQTNKAKTTLAVIVGRRSIVRRAIRSTVVGARQIGRGEPEASEMVWSSADGHVKRAGPGGDGPEGGGPGGDGSGRDEDDAVCVEGPEICNELEEGTVETEPVAEVTEIRWEVVEDDTWASEVVMTLEIEAAADDIEDTVDEAVALETTCVCFTVKAVGLRKTLMEEMVEDAKEAMGLADDNVELSEEGPEVATETIELFDTPGAVDEARGSTWMEEEVIRGIDVDTDAVERLPEELAEKARLADEEVLRDELAEEDVILEELVENDVEELVEVDLAKAAAARAVTVRMEGSNMTRDVRGLVDLDVGIKTETHQCLYMGGIL